MGRGGKKKGKKDAEEKGGGDVPSVAKLSISDDGASTSQAPDPPQEEDCGLGLGGGRKKNKKQNQAAAAKATPVSQAPIPPVEEASMSQAKPESKPEPKSDSKPQQQEEQSDGLGLELPGAKKRPKKKKPQGAADVPASREGPGGPPQGSQPIQGQPASQPGFAQPAPQPGLGQPQHGFGQPAQQPGFRQPAPQPGFGQPAPPPGIEQPGQWQPPLGRGQPPFGRGQPPFGRGQPPGPMPAGPGQLGPMPAGPGQPGPMPAGPGQPGPMPAGPCQPGPRPPGPGQAGRGAPAPWQVRPSGPPPGPSPVQQKTQQPAATQPQQLVPLAPSRQEIGCRYKIPIKVLGNTVKHSPTRVMTNYLPMTFKTIKVYRYDVTVKPEKPKKMLPAVFKLAKDKYYRNDLIAFDQVKNCYSLTQLKDVPMNSSGRHSIPVDITDNNGKAMKFEVTFKFTGVVDFGKIKQHMDTGGSSLNTPSEEIQCIDVILRQGALEAYVKCGRTFFKRPERPIDLSGGLEMWTGLFQSAIFTSHAFINIDVAHKGFPKEQPLINALTNAFRLDTNCRVEDQRSREVENFLSFIKNLKVKAKVLASGQAKEETRDFMCNMLIDSAHKVTFTIERDGKSYMVSVYDYFAKEKGYKIKYPNLNCVWVGPRDKSIYYPMELLSVAYGQPTNKQLNDIQLSTMVKEAATPPIDRKAKIEEVAKCMNYSSNIFFKKFGLEISNKFLEVGAKILTPPSLNCGDRFSITPRKGSWQTNRLVKPEALVSWGFVAIDCNHQQSNYESIRDLLIQGGRQLGMNVAAPQMQVFNVKMTELRSLLFQAVEKDVRFLFIIVSSRGRDIYHKVKQMAERDVGILTQCIKEFTASRRINPQTIKNILLKVNSKLMGINQVLDNSVTPNCIKNGDVMIVGADVTHPSPDQSNIPSIAAVTASMDPKCFIYNIELSIQTPKKEMIVEFADMMFDHLLLWRERNRALPRKIYVFRDGVSEGQFAAVMNSELAAVHKAYQRLSPQGKPEVLFLLVQKRHHTRFFTVPHCNNVEPGTVVDTHIVHPKELDFYLVSHQAIKGTARPTRYHAVCNDGNIPNDEVEQLTYYLCHLYARCMRSVSYPTPTYYAHLACLRARSLTHGQTFDNAALEGKPQRLRVLDKMLRFSRMFFV